MMAKNNTLDANQIADDIWEWMKEFVARPNEFYNRKFAPCPFARQALARSSVDVVVWLTGDLRKWISDQAAEMRNSPNLTTRVMVLPSVARRVCGLLDYIEALNVKMVSQNIFLNPGVAQNTRSRDPKVNGDPYFIVVANSLDAVLKGAEALRQTDYYTNWPSAHFDFVVNRRARLARRHAGSDGAE